MFIRRLLVCLCAEDLEQSEAPALVNGDRTRPARGLGGRAAVAAILVALSPLADADIVSTGTVSPITITPPPPVTGTVSGVLGVAPGSDGTLTVNLGSVLTADALSVANGGAAVIGTVNIIGTLSFGQTVVNLLGPSGAFGLNPFELGNFGDGRMTVSQGAIVNVAIGNTNCIANGCPTFIGNAAGSTALLKLQDGGTTMNLVGGFFVGNGAVFGTTFGTPSGTTNATVEITNGATLNTDSATLSTGPGGPQQTGNEHTVATVTVDGAGSRWQVTQNELTDAQARINMATSPNATATLTVSNGGQVNVTGGSITSYIGVGDGGTATLNVLSGGLVTAADMALGNQATGVGKVTVGGTSSALTIGNGLTVGNQSIGTSPSTLSTLTVNSGGTVTVSGNSGGNLAIGMNTGSHGAVTVDGGTLIVSGIGAGNTGTGTLTVQNGGQVTSGYLSVGNNRFVPGNPAGGVGTVNVGNGSGSSSLTITGGVTIGQQTSGANALNINTGGTVTLTGTNPGGLAIAQSAGSEGAVTVDGGALNLAAATSGIGVGNGGIGALTVQNGGLVTVSSNGGVGVGGGTGSSGTVLVDGGTLNLSGANSNLGVGNGGTGTLTIQNVGQVSVANLNVGNNSTGVGTVTVGSGSTLTLAKGMAIGQQGTGTMTVQSGGTVVCGSTTCGFSVIGNGAGSTGSLTISGGSVTGMAQLNVGGATAVSGFGTPGGSTTATLLIEGGGTLGTRGFSAVGASIPTAAPALGTENVNSTVTIDGDGSSWQVAVNEINGENAQVAVSRAPNATGTIDIINGGKLLITGGTPTDPTNTPGLQMSGGSIVVGGTSTVNVNGVGSAIVIAGDTGFINVGRNGGTATLNIGNGAQVYGTGTNGLTFLNVARLGSDASLNVDGTGSSVILSGVGSSVTGNGGIGAGGIVGREAGSIGAINVTNGGTILVRDGGQAATATGVGFTFGRDAGATGSLIVSGTNSKVTIEQTGTGSTAGPGMTVGFDGSGNVQVLAGGAIVISDTGLAGGGITIARNSGSSGVVTVSGTGSSITVGQTGVSIVNPGITVGRNGTGEMLVTDGATVAVNGTSQRNFNVGNAAGGSGTLTVSSGAAISSSYFTVGNNGGTGIATINAAFVNLDGQILQPDNSVTGAGFRVGRGTDSVGTLNLVNGAQVTINTAATTPEIFLGGTGLAPGGDGTINMSGGSSIAFTGTGATPQVVIGHSGTGLMTMDGASTLNLLHPDPVLLNPPATDGSITIGSRSTGVGQLEIRGGSSVQTGSMIVGNNGQGTVLLTSGTLGINNSSASALIIGAGNTGIAGAPGGTGSFTQTGGSVTVSGGLTIGQGSSAGATAGGTGEYVLRGGTLTVTGSTIVGGAGADSSLGGIGTLFVLEGATMNAGTLLGIGHDGSQSNGATGTVILDGGANIYATNIGIGAGGCLGGNGTVHGNLVGNGIDATIDDCDTGVTPRFTTLANGPGNGVGIEGFLKPGRSPGRLAIDGRFQCIVCTIVLDVELINGVFVTDELVFTQNTTTLLDPLIMLKGLNIFYAFLGDTDPNAFAASNEWVLDTFFKINTTGDPSAPTGDQGISMLTNAQGDPVPLDTLFADSTFAATSPSFVIEEFVFTPADGVTSIDAVPIPPESTVPEPSTIWLMLLGSLLLLRSAGMRRLAARTRRM